MDQLKLLNRTSAEETITISPKAIAEIKRLKMENSIPETHGLRIGVKGGGCSGLTYVLGFDENVREGDEIMEFDGVRVFVDPKSLMSISGTELDFTDGLAGRGFIFNNPHATKTCGCGSSFGV